MYSRTEDSYNDAFEKVPEEFVKYFEENGPTVEKCGWNFPLKEDAV